MDYQHYLKLFEEIINNNTPQPPYNAPDYLQYAKLNFSRMNRWHKTLQLDEELANELKKINTFQKWIIIVEPWCGDAHRQFLFWSGWQSKTHSSNMTCNCVIRNIFNQLLSDKWNQEHSKVIVRDEKENDLFTWGPRPMLAQQLVSELKAANVDYDTLKTQLQNWYNKDKGRELQKELLQLFRKLQLHQDIDLIEKR